MDRCTSLDVFSYLFFSCSSRCISWHKHAPSYHRRLIISDVHYPSRNKSRHAQQHLEARARNPKSFRVARLRKAMEFAIIMAWNGDSVVAGYDLGFSACEVGATAAGCSDTYFLECLFMFVFLVDLNDYFDAMGYGEWTLLRWNLLAATVRHLSRHRRLNFRMSYDKARSLPSQ